jgi:hypothetical protein
MACIRESRLVNSSTRRSQLRKCSQGKFTEAVRQFLGKFSVTWGNFLRKFTENIRSGVADLLFVGSDWFLVIESRYGHSVICS